MEAVVEVPFSISSDEGELCFKIGDVITNVSQVDKSWYMGSLDEKKIRFQKEFVKIIPSETSCSNDIDGNLIPEKKESKKRHIVKSVYSYTPSNEDELELKLNDIIEVIEETEEGWWKGILNGKVGMFPSNFVVKHDGEDKAKSEPSAETKKRNSALLSLNQPSPPPHKLTPDKRNIPSCDKDGSASQKKTSSNVRKSQIGTSADSSVPQLPPKPVREQAKVLYPYEAQNVDELSLKEGDIITIISKEIEDKGWWKGELNNHIGVFPDNFVELIKSEEKGQKKPERPEKPNLPVTPKVSLKSDPPDKHTKDLPSSPFDKKSTKTPPAKPPPPPELLRIARQYPSKKPQIPPPVKKPLRHSIGAKLPGADSLASELSSDSTSSSRRSSLPKSVEKTIDSPTMQNNSEIVKDGLVFDFLQSSTDKLVHLTANRVKLPNRRPPSQMFLKENDKVNGFTAEPDLNLKEISEAQSKPELQKQVNIKSFSTSKPALQPTSVEEKSRVPPQRPVFPLSQISNTVNRVSQLEITTTNTSVSATSLLQQTHQIIPSTESQESKSKPAAEDCTPQIPKDQSAIQAELVQLRKEFKLLKESTVPKQEFEKLVSEVTELKDALKLQKSICKKYVLGLRAQFEEEKKVQTVIQQELESLKKEIRSKD